MSRIDGWHYDDREELSALLGQTLAKVEVEEDKSEIHFETVDGKRYALYHSQDCCESVTVEDVTGDLADLIGEPLLEAEAVSHDADEYTPNPAAPKPSEHAESWTWTFYKFGTRKGSVTIRWLGQSNGYYSERVDFIRLPPVTDSEVKHQP